MRFLFYFLKKKKGKDYDLYITHSDLIIIDTHYIYIETKSFLFVHATLTCCICRLHDTSGKQSMKMSASQKSSNVLYILIALIHLNPPRPILKRETVHELSF
jgi:hypothetical protein